MIIKNISFLPYEILLANGQKRNGVFLYITDETGHCGKGEIAPLPGWSKETLQEAVQSLENKRDRILDIDWTPQNYMKELEALKLLPSTLFGLESAVLSFINPLPKHKVQTSALFMGSKADILEQASLRQREGYVSAKLKVSNHSFEDAFDLINKLKDTFRLRIDVNRAWNTKDSLKFFAQFPMDAFDYVEEPFQNPNDLKLFTHHLAVDESFPSDLSLKDLESLPTLKALIYKPTIQGGMVGCLALHEWTKKREIDLVLSSAFESTLGLTHIASMAYRLSLTAPVGIGTYHYLNSDQQNCNLHFENSLACVAEKLL